MTSTFTNFKFCSAFSFLVALIFFITLSQDIQAQKTTATIRIINAKKEPVPFATVILTQINDSSNTFNNISDSNGVTVFEVIRSPYLVSVSAINFVPFKKGINIKSDRPIFTFTAELLSKSLKEVIVTTTRPIMRQEDDKTIVDPENLAASSTNAYEILEKTPGLFVDQDGNVYLSSTTPASIYINGREQKMSTADIATMLKNLPPNSIASIEILRTPSAKYDASGGGGIINIVLKKGVKIGFTGSVTLGGNQGVKGAQYLGLNLNNNNGKTSIYLNLQVGNRNYSEQVRTDRIFAPDSLLSQDAFSQYPTNNYYLGSGVSFPVGKKWEMSVDSRINFSYFINTTKNYSQIKRISTGGIKTDNVTFVDNTGNNFNINQGASLKYKIDSTGSEWTTDMSYNYSPNNSNQNFITYYTSNLPTAGDGKIKTRLNFFSVQTNLLYKLPKKLNFEAGLKASFVNFINITDYYYQYNGSRLINAGRSSSYNYREYINAAYLQASKTIYGITLKAGTRLENTNMKGNQLIPNDTTFSLNRTDLFPYIYISKNLFKIMKYDLRAYLVYRRTISRPGYQLLNPSLRYVDQYLFETGNPGLRPQFTQNYEANVSVDERPIIAIGVNETKDIFTNVIYQADSSHSIAYRTYDNLGRNKEVYFRALGAIPPGGKYFIVAGMQYNQNFYQGLYEGKPLSFNKASWSIFTYQTLKITQTTQLTLNGFARFKGQLQFYELSTFGALNVSLTQQLLKRKLIITGNITDIFKTNNNDFTINQGSVNASGFRKGDTRRIGLTLRYNFGFRKKEENNFFNIDSPEKSN